MPADPQIHIRTDAGPVNTEHLVVVLAVDRPVPKGLLRQVEALAGPHMARAVADPDVAAPPPHQVVRVSRTAADVAAAAASVGRHAPAGTVVDCLLPAVQPELIARFAQGAVMGAQRMGSDSAATLVLHVTGADRTAAAETGANLGARILFARSLANTPSNRKSPLWLARQAQAVAGGALKVQTHGTDWLASHGFGGILAVGAGSANPPNLTTLTYRGSGSGPHVVLVGKGITFDSGGLSLKPATSMPLMKTDMSGAASVIAAMAAVRDRGLAIRVTGLIACAENMPSGSAMRPGDVIRHYGGRTTEVLNTDAEGRLVLADALAFAAERLRPDYMVDLATLTGAATVGLGRQHAALYSTSDRLARDLMAAADAGGDPVWRMPLVEEYTGAIDSVVADSANTNTDPHIQAGSITAALFLRQFTAGLPWAHLDIAGTGRTESDRADCRKGATGFGVSLLTRWLGRHRR